MFKRSVGALLFAAGGVFGSGFAAHAQDARDAEILGFHQLCDHGDRARLRAADIRIARSPGVASTRNGPGGIADAQTEGPAARHRPSSPFLCFTAPRSRGMMHETIHSVEPACT